MPCGDSILNRRLALLVLASVVGACESKPPTSPTVDLSGRWDGTIESATDGTGSVRLDLTQAGRTVQGTTHLAQSGISDVPGTFLGTLASETLPTTIQYTVTYEYRLSVSGHIQRHTRHRKSRRRRLVQRPELRPCVRGAAPRHPSELKCDRGRTASPPHHATLHGLNAYDTCPSPPIARLLGPSWLVGIRPSPVDARSISTPARQKAGEQWCVQPARHSF